MTDPTHWLVFDLGGVLVEVASADRTLSRLASRTDTAKSHLAMVLREQFSDRPYSLAERFQVGALDEHGFHAALNRELRQPLAFAALIEELEAMLLGEKPETVALLGLLARRHRIACYSNTNATHWRYIQRHFDFVELIDRPFVSQQVGFAKPDPRGFAAVAEALSMPPQRCLLVDDRGTNVDGALAAGWQARLFTNAETLADELAVLDIEESTP